MNECYYVLDVVLPYPVSVVDTSVTDMGILSFPILTRLPAPDLSLSHPDPPLSSPPASSKPKLKLATTVYSPN